MTYLLADDFTSLELHLRSATIFAHLLCRDFYEEPIQEGLLNTISSRLGMIEAMSRNLRLRLIQGQYQNSGVERLHCISR